MGQAPSKARSARGIPGLVIGRGAGPATIVGTGRAAPASVAMELAAGEDGFRLALLDRHGRTLLRLGPHAEEDVVAEWRALGSVTGLPLTMLLPNGAVLALYEQVGAVRIGEARTPDRRRDLNGRRPRFLTRRKTGRVARRPRIHRGIELASGKEV